MSEASLFKVGVVATLVTISFALPYIIGILINFKMDR
jgi:hypothetical protein